MISEAHSTKSTEEQTVQAVVSTTSPVPAPCPVCQVTSLTSVCAQLYRKKRLWGAEAAGAAEDSGSLALPPPTPHYRGPDLM